MTRASPTRAAPTRLGDLLRVVHELQPDPHELRLIGELLPDRRPGGPEDDDAGSRRRRSRESLPAPTGEHPAAVLAPPPVEDEPPERRKDRDKRREARRQLLPEPGPRERVVWAVFGLVLLVVLALQVSGQIRLAPWLLLVVLLPLGWPGWWYLHLGWTAWWRSPHHLAATAAVPETVPEGDDPTAGDVTLTHVRWREPPHGVPLVRRSQQRAVATLLAGRAVPGDIDLVETVRRAASRQSLLPVPRRLRWSTNLGMQLHVDMGPALDPFRNDIEQLHDALATIASPHGVVERGFEGDPREITWPPRLVGHGARRSLGGCLPPPGTPVLVVTDLGIAVPRAGSAPGPRALLDHHRLLDQAGCTVRYLVPYPPERWPVPLRGLPIVEWTDDLGAGDVLGDLRRRVRVR